MHLVDEEDGVVGVGRLLDDALQALLELTAVLGARHETGQVERPDILVHQVLGHIACRNLLRQPLDDGRLAHTGVAQDERVVLGAAGEDLHHAEDLLLAADYRVELAGARLLGQVGGIALEGRGVLVALARRRRAREERQPRAGTPRAGARERTLTVLVLGRELLYGLTDRRRRDTEAHQQVHAAALRIVHHAQKQVLGGDVGLVVLACQAEGTLHHRNDQRGEGELLARGTRGGGAVRGTGDVGIRTGGVCRGGAGIGRHLRGRVGCIRDGVGSRGVGSRPLSHRGAALSHRLRRALGGRRARELLENLVVGNIERAQRLGGDALVLFGKREQQMLGSDFGGVERKRLLLGDCHNAPSAIGESVQHRYLLYVRSPSARGGRT